MYICIYVYKLYNYKYIKIITADIYYKLINNHRNTSNASKQ